MTLLSLLILSQLSPSPLYRGADGGWVQRVSEAGPANWHPDGGSIGSVVTPLDAPGTIDSFGALRVGTQLNQIDVPFFRGTVASLTTVTLTGTGSTTTTSGAAVLSTGAGVTSSSRAVSPTTVAYRGGSEVYAYFTATFTPPTSASSFQRIGLYNDANGLYIGWNGLTFVACVRDATVDSCTAKASWNVDTLTGAAGSRFTRNGVPEAINLAYLNVYRVRFGWLGAAPIEFEVLSPDGQWVIFHKVLYPNTAAIPSLDTADLPMTAHVSKTSADATDLRLTTGCWAAGTTTNLQKLNDTLADGTLATLTRSVITGVTTGGGGSYVNVKVTPSGALASDVTGTVNVSNFDGGVWIASMPAITGTVTANGPLTDAQLRASAVVVSAYVGFDGGAVAPIYEAATQGTTQPTAAVAGASRRAVLSTDGAQYVRSGGPVTWSCSLDAIAASLTQCQAAPGAGLKLYVTDVTIQSTTATAGLYLLRTGTGTNCGTGTASLFPSAATVARFTYPGNTAATPSAYRFSTPIAAPANTALCIICTATNTCSVSIQGYTAP